jgi:hypothetical protein
MALVVEKNIKPAATPTRPQTPEAEPRLSIDVVFTSIETMPAALRLAVGLATRLAARITLVVPQVVPYPLPLESPPVLIDWSERRFSLIAEESSVETSVQIYLCRERIKTIRTVLKPHSVVVIADRKRWWPTWETRLSRVLRRAGHEVIIAQAE